MDSNPPILLLLVIVLTTSIPFSSAHAGPEKKTRLHLYFHEIFSGPNITAITVASLNHTSSKFGDTSVIDDHLRDGPEPTSRLIGYAQGITVQASVGAPAFLFMTNFVFTQGKYNGSTIAVIGRATFSDTRDYTVVGGGGLFRSARGYVHGKVVDSPAGSLVIEFDVIVMHY